MLPSVSAASIKRHLGSLQHESDARPAYLALADGLRQLLLDGRLPIGAALPSERQLASSLDVSRTTVTAAFANLRDRGYLSSRQGARSTMSIPGGSTRSAARATDPDERGYLNLDWAAPAAPPGLLHEMYLHSLEQLPHYFAGSGIAPQGIEPLRQAVAQRYCDRGAHTTPDQILIASGAQAAFRLVLEVLVAPGDRVMVEHPTYPNGVDAITRAGARPVAVALHTDAESADGGWDFDTIGRALRRDAPRVMLSFPDFHNPTGLLLPDESRDRYARLAARHGSILVVDETMCDLGLDRPAAIPMADFGRPADIVTIGSMSKLFWPGLRIGWIRAERDLIDRITIARAAMDLGTSIIEQLTATQALHRIDDAIALRTAALRESRAVANEVLHQEIPGCTMAPGLGGIALWARLPDPLSTAIASAAASFGVRISSGTRYGVDGSFEQYLRIPYTQAPEPLRNGIELLGQAYRSVRSGSAHHEVRRRSVLV